jgi:hypothetical protein
MYSLSMKKTLIVAIIVVALLSAARFVPIKERTGYLDRGQNNLCIGYDAPNVYSKRVILSGFSEPQYFVSNPQGLNDGSDATCVEPVVVQYFLI